MARKFLVPIDLTKQELQNARVQNLASAPSSPVAGQIYYDTATNILYFYDGTSWCSTKVVSSLSQGLLSARPTASTAGNNAIYFATDNLLLYVSNGTTWTQSSGFGTITAQTSYGASSGNGSSTNYARADHTHGTPSLTAVTPQALTIAGTGAVGTGTAPAREDHVHAGPGFGSITAQTTFGASSDNGSATTPARSDHTHGTPAHDAAAHSAIKISDLAAPTASVAFNAQKITGLADPTLAQDAATKAYVDGVASGLNIHDAVLVATTANLVGTYTAGTTGADGGTGVGATITITATGILTIDVVNLVQFDRVLVKNQTTQTQNGIYYVSTAGDTGVQAVLTRVSDYDNSVAGEITAGDFIFVDQGSTQANTGWAQTETGTSTTPVKGIKIGTDNISYSQFSGAGTYTASNGVLLTGSNFTFAPSTTGGLQTGAGGGSVKLATNSGLGTDANGLAVGAGTGITVSTGTVAINTSVVARKYAVSVGDASASSFTVTHNLGTLDAIVQVYTVSDGTQVEADVTRATTNTVTVAFAVAPTSNQYRVVVLG
jgi:hypothetical protein